MTEAPLMVLEEFPDAFSAHVVKDFLKSHGIETFVFDEFTHNMAFGTDSLYIRLMISPEDFDDACDLLDEQEALDG
jgi:hypothetical protein